MIFFIILIVFRQRDRLYRTPCSSSSVGIIELSRENFLSLEFSPRVSSCREKLTNCPCSPPLANGLSREPELPVREKLNVLETNKKTTQRLKLHLYTIAWFVFISLINKLLAWGKRLARGARERSRRERERERKCEREREEKCTTSSLPRSRARNAFLLLARIPTMSSRKEQTVEHRKWKRKCKRRQRERKGTSRFQGALPQIRTRGRTNTHSHTR